MQTRQTYYDDIYLDYLEANVISCKEYNYKYYTILDETIFLPEGGGMLADKGFINDIEVIDVIKKDGEILHITHIPLEGSVNLKLDLDNRLKAIQGHDGQHLISAILRKDYNLNTISHHALDNYFDILLDCESVDPSIIEDVQAKANALIVSDDKLDIFYLDKSELDRYNIKDNPKYDNPVRITNIQSLGDYNACGCLHFSSLRHLQSLIILDVENTSRGVRITYTVGQALLDYFNKQNKIVNKLFNISKSNADNVLANMENLIAKNEHLTSELNDIKNHYYQIKIESLINNQEFLVVDDVHHAKDLRNIALLISSSSYAVAGILQARVEDHYSFIIVKSKTSEYDIEDLFNKIKAKHELKGGGKGLSISGQSPDNIAKEIHEYL